ncbi:MAG: metallophosphoesterase [Acutalibacteraceae bacterium]|nr:metallophosphoesterase [Acutalibacteraceae bacterium]
MNKKIIMRTVLIVFLALVAVLITGIVYFEIEPENTNIDFKPADSQKVTDTTIKFNSDGKLKVLHIADTHLNYDKHFDASIWVIAEACDVEKPDLVVLTGDNTHPNEEPEKTKKLINALMNIFESRNIPVAVTFGNHDSESGPMTREDIMEYYNTFSCVISTDNSMNFKNCATFNIPVLASDSDKVKFNLWVFDSGDYDEDDPRHYDRVRTEQIEWYKQTSAKLKEENGGETVNSLVFQHIIVPEIYDVLKKVDSKQPYAIEHIYNKEEYYAFNPENINYGTLNEKPCPGYYNDGQFDALVENGDVLAMFTGHDHTNAFGVRNQGIDIYTSPMTRYKGLAYTTQYGYRVVEIDENDTSTYETRVERLYDVFDFGYIKTAKENGDKYSKRIAFELAVKGKVQELFLKIYQSAVELVTGRQVTYPD